MNRFILTALLSTALAAPASAALLTTDFGTLVPGYSPGDDETYTVALPFTFNYFGTDYNSVAVANNGNVQFGSNNGAFFSQPLNTTTIIRAIAPFWTDLFSARDPLGPIVPLTGGSGVYVNSPTPNQIIFTWDRLGYFVEDYGGRVQFQLVLNNPNAAIPAGQAEIGIYYGTLELPSQIGSQFLTVSIGFGDGLSSVNPGEISLFSGTRRDVIPAINAGPGSYLFGVRGGVPEQVPAPASLALLGTGLAAAGMIRRRRPV